MIINDRTGSIAESKEADDNVVSLENNILFYNAKDTTGDRIYIDNNEYDGSFIDYWCEKTGKESNTHIRCMNKFCMNVEVNDIVGAHVVCNKDDVQLSEGDKFYIIPLCKKCNHHTNTSAMMLDHSIKAPILIWTGKKGLYKTR